MVKRGSSTFSAASVAKGSVVLSRAIEKNFALEAEVSRLRHHISVLSRRLHFVTLERDGLVDMVAPTMFVEEGEKWGETPLTDEEVAGEGKVDEATLSVAGSVCPSVAMVEVAGEAGEVAVDEAALSVAGEVVEDSHDVAGEVMKDSHDVAGDEVAKEATLSVAGEEVVDCHCEGALREKIKHFEDMFAKVFEEESVEDRERRRERRKRREENTVGEVGVVERVPEMAEGCNRFKMDLVEEVVSPSPDPTVGEGLKSLEGRLVSSDDEDAVISGVIVAGGASQKARNAARKKKRKIRRGEASGRGGGG